MEHSSKKNCLGKHGYFKSSSCWQAVSWLLFFFFTKILPLIFCWFLSIKPLKLLGTKAGMVHAFKNVLKVRFTKAKVRRGLRTNCHVKWSAQKGIGEGSGRLCQTDGTPCCVFDWKRKVTFAATSKRQWSAKQIGLWSTPVLERGLLQGGTREAVFHSNATCASFSRAKGDALLSFAPSF